MKIKNGKIKKINKKLIVGMATFVLVATLSVPLSEDYKTNREEQVITDTVYYDDLKNYYFIEVLDNSKNTSEFHICKRTPIKNVLRFYETIAFVYKDIFTNQEICDRNIYNFSRYSNFNSDLEITKEIEVEDFLVSSDNVKKEYKKEEVEKMLSELEDLNLKESEKQLVK